VVAKADKPNAKPADPKPASVKDGKDKAAKDKAAKEKEAGTEAPKEAKPAEPEPDIARQRALVIVEYLLQAGIPADRIVAAPAGRANATGQGVGLALRS
jgi:hypothetical protein